MRSEARKSLGMLALEERRDRKQFGCCNHSLPAAAMDPHLEHDMHPVSNAYPTGRTSVGL